MGWNTYEPMEAEHVAARTLRVIPSRVSAPFEAECSLGRRGELNRQSREAGGVYILILEELVCSQPKARIYDFSKHRGRESLHETQRAFGANHLRADGPERIVLRAWNCANYERIRVIADNERRLTLRPELLANLGKHVIKSSRSGKA